MRSCPRLSPAAEYTLRYPNAKPASHDHVISPHHIYVDCRRAAIKRIRHKKWVLTHLIVVMQAAILTQIAG